MYPVQFSNNQSSTPLSKISLGKEPKNQIEELSQPVNLDKVHKMHEEAKSLSSTISELGYHSAEEKDKLDEVVRILNEAIDLDNILTASPRDFGIDELKDSDQYSVSNKTPWLRFDRGFNHIRLGNYKKAVEDFAEELSLHESGEGVFHSLYERAFANKMLEKYDLAISDFRAAKETNGVYDQITQFSDIQINDITSNKNTIFNNVFQFVNKLGIIGNPNNILGLEKEIEDQLLELGEEKIGKIFNYIYDYKKINSSEFSNFLKKLEIATSPVENDNPLSKNLKKVFEELSDPKKAENIGYKEKVLKNLLLYAKEVQEKPITINLNLLVLKLNLKK